MCSKPPLPRLLLTAATLACFSAAPLRAQTILRYGFQVGDQFVYERQTVTTPLDADRPRTLTVEQILVTCVARQDEQARLVVEVTRRSAAEPTPVVGLMLTIDPQGRRQIPPEQLARAAQLDAALDVLPRLGAGLAQGETWQTAPDFLGRSWECTRRGPDPAHDGAIAVEFTAHDRSRAWAALQVSKRGRYWFDPRAGRLIALESDTQDACRNQQHGVVVALRRAGRTDADVSRGWAADIERYRKAVQTEQALLRDLTRRPREVETTLRDLRRIWDEAVRDLAGDPQSPALRLARGRQRSLPKEEAALRARAAAAQAWLGEPAIGWALEDPNGVTVTSDAARRGWTMECFWSVGEPRSLEALAALRRLHAGAQAESLSVVAINMDADPEVARTACRAVAAGLPQLVCGAPLRAVEQLPELPAFRLIDPEGIVRRVDFGWVPSLAEPVQPAPPQPQAQPARIERR